MTSPLFATNTGRTSSPACIASAPTSTFISVENAMPLLRISVDVRSRSFGSFLRKLSRSACVTSKSVTLRIRWRT